MKQTKYVTTSFHRQYKHLSQMLTVGMRRCPDDLWDQTVPGWKWTVGEMVWHAISSTFFGERALSRDRSMLERRVTKEAVAEALEDIHRFIQKELLTISDQELIDNGKNDDSGGFCIKHLMYALRHTQHHVGEFTQVLAQNGVTPPAWPTGNRL